MGLMGFMGVMGVLMLASCDRELRKELAELRNELARQQQYVPLERDTIRDSVGIAVKKEYKHRFLFLKWGTKGYQVKVMNFNPNATIRYNTFVKRKE